MSNSISAVPQQPRGDLVWRRRRQNWLLHWLLHPSSLTFDLIDLVPFFAAIMIKITPPSSSILIPPYSNSNSLKGTDCLSSHLKLQILPSPSILYLSLPHSLLPLPRCSPFSFLISRAGSSASFWVIKMSAGRLKIGELRSEEAQEVGDQGDWGGVSHGWRKKIHILSVFVSVCILLRRWRLSVTLLGKMSDCHHYSQSGLAVISYSFPSSPLPLFSLGTHYTV